MIITFIYTEGPHDVAFLSKIISAHPGNKNEVKKVSSLPDILKQLIVKALEQVETDKIRIDKPLSVFYPNKVFELEEEHYICIFSTGGKDRLQASFSNIDKSKLLLGRKDHFGIRNINHAFVLDADYVSTNGGIKTTLDNLGAGIRSLIEDFPGFDTSSSWVENDTFGRIGAFVFTDSGKEEGTLEDLLEELVDNTTLSSSSDEFTSKIVEFDKECGSKAKDKTKLQKVKFTSMTQAFHPGSSLAVGLYGDNIVNINKLNEHDIFKDFIGFLDSK